MAILLILSLGVTGTLHAADPLFSPVIGGSLEKCSPVTKRLDRLFVSEKPALFRAHSARREKSSGIIHLHVSFQTATGH
jgi:hypothetical protein